MELVYDCVFLQRKHEEFYTEPQAMIEVERLGQKITEKKRSNEEVIISFEEDGRQVNK
jgi:hypothetical protein